MSECWAPEPGGRPSFKKLMDLLGDILDEGERDNYLDLSRKFDVTVGKSVGATADNKGYLEGMRGCDYGTQGRYSMLLSVLLMCESPYSMRSIPSWAVTQVRGIIGRVPISYLGWSFLASQVPSDTPYLSPWPGVPICQKCGTLLI